MQEVTTEVRFRDASAVALTDGEGKAVLEAGASEADAPLGEGRIPTGAASTAGYAVRARRESDGSLSVEWRTSLPLANGDRHTVLGAHGSLVVDGPADEVTPPAVRAAPTLRLERCTRLQSTGTKAGGVTVSARDCVPALPPASSGVVPYGLEADWTDVAEIRERTRVDHGAGWLIFGASTITFGALSTMLLSFPSQSYTGGMKTKIGVSALTVGLGVAFDAGVFPTLVTPSHDRVLFPASGAETPGGE